MQIVASNHADSLRRRMSENTPEALVVDTVSGELRVFYGEAADDLPPDMIALVIQLDGGGIDRVHAT